ncbi:hypothetical protein KIN20_016872 [Parelaphostrongylus tenuis]|uniref:Uncharacterized protein n=1 Tax=Parelaphostrongylus tenuis TaxID=148309 RepID=A0AAD5N1U9_PARTN|nr:hypothetical protein KIN20_016868 [Parelaphostrongylus tenuis]KAJ1358445.1 hypothetical protein KIN20_016872 [Parelaphostrongylus tenuis]
MVANTPMKIPSPANEHSIRLLVFIASLIKCLLHKRVEYRWSSSPCNLENSQAGCSVGQSFLITIAGGTANNPTSDRPVIDISHEFLLYSFLPIVEFISTLIS